MRNNKYFRFTKNIFPLLILGSLLLSFPFIGTECGVIINGELISLDKFLGQWALARQTGYLQDICIGEKVIYKTDYYATLICPGKDTAFEKFRVNNQFNTITYLSTNVTYRYEFTTVDSGTYMNLYGVNVGRNLHYLKIGTLDNNYDKQIIIKEEGNTVNSSDLQQ